PRARRAPNGRHHSFERVARCRLTGVVANHAALLEQVVEGAHRGLVRYSHSIVAGGFDVTSSTTRFTPGISFTIRAEIASTRSYGSRAQSAVIASSLVTARIAIGYPYVRSSPWTPTERTAGSTANDCHSSP